MSRIFLNSGTLIVIVCSNSYVTYFSHKSGKRILFFLSFPMYKCLSGRHKAFSALNIALGNNPLYYSLQLFTEEKGFCKLRGGNLTDIMYNVQCLLNSLCFQTYVTELLFSIPHRLKLSVKRKMQNDINFHRLFGMVEYCGAHHESF